jgi:3',5'-cyclic AMP phosphodiesterase CpdA
MITLVHISDFHFSRAKRRDQTIVVDALVRDLQHLATVEGVHPSIVIFSGDLVQTGDDLPLFEEAANLLLKPVLGVLALGPVRSRHIGNSLVQGHG